MYRVISFVIIFSIVTSMLYLHNQSSHFSASNHEMMHQANQIVIPQNHTAPTITGSVTQDLTGAWLLEIKTENFTFEPKLAGSTEISYNEGHAHIYVNEKKLNRLYGEYYNLDMLSSGTHQIKVTLNGNNHGVFMYEGKEVAFSETIHVP
ncbi:hypothetical protein [Ferdinandcohnia sp. Marseille-Q9671]